MGDSFCPHFLPPPLEKPRSCPCKNSAFVYNGKGGGRETLLLLNYSREVYMKGIDHSYYEGYITFKTQVL